MNADLFSAVQADRKRSGNLLCELVLTEAHRNEVVAAYEQQRKDGPYPSLAVQIFVFSAKTYPTAAVYLAHFADVLMFAIRHSLIWLKDAVMKARKDYRARQN